MKDKALIFFYIVLAVFVNYSCTKNIDIELPADSSKIIVEGTIENDRPPFVILSKSFEIFSPIDINNLDEYFVHNAIMRVSNGVDSVLLVEYCLNDLPFTVEQKEQLLESFGFGGCDTCFLPNICVYSVPDVFNFFLSGTCSFMGEENTSYNLKIEVENKVFTAVTSIPTARGIDFLSVKPHPKPSVDSLVSVYVNITFPSTSGNYIRYWTKRNKEPFYAPISQSVYEDRLVVGQFVSLPLERGQNPNEKVNFDTYSYFWKGDTVEVKWSNIDARTFDFFYTLENDGGGSPFASYIRVKSNIIGEGAFGVWAGYASRYSKIIIPE